MFLPVTEKGCTFRRWMRNMMTRVGIDPKWTGGSIRMAASSKALDDGVEPAYIMQIGRWRSFAMWNALYNRSCSCLGRTFAAGIGLRHRFYQPLPVLCMLSKPVLAGPPVFDHMSKIKAMQTDGQIFRTVAPHPPARISFLIVFGTLARNAFRRLQFLK